jgi:hypothetical protein
LARRLCAVTVRRHFGPLFHLETSSSPALPILSKRGPPARRSHGHRTQPELPQTFVGPCHQFRFVGHGMSSVLTNRLEQPQEDHRAICKPAIQCNLFAGLVGPLQFGVLHKKRFVVIPTGTSTRYELVTRCSAVKIIPASASCGCRPGATATAVTIGN